MSASIITTSLLVLSFSIGIYIGQHPRFPALVAVLQGAPLPADYPSSTPKETSTPEPAASTQPQLASSAIPVNPELELPFPRLVWTPLDSKPARLLRDRGWRDVTDPRDASFLFVRDRRDRHQQWRLIHRGQMVNYLQGQAAMTNKGLLNMHLTRAGDDARRVQAETYLLYEREGCDRFFEEHPPGTDDPSRLWIVKPIVLSNGIGMRVMWDLSELRDELGHCGRADQGNGRPLPHVQSSEAVIVQEYIADPMLIDGYKTETRAYVAVISLQPLMVLMHLGPVRRNSVKYTLDPDKLVDPKVHITNIRQQKEHKSFKKIKDDLKMPFKRIADELIAQGIAPAGDHDWLIRRMKRTVRRVIQATRHEWADQPWVKEGTFNLFGADFMVTRGGKHYLSEIQLNPGLSWTDKIKRHLIPKMLNSMLDMLIEVQRRRLLNLPLSDGIDELRDEWEWVINEATDPPFELDMSDE